MNIRNQLLQAHSKSNTKKIVDFIGSDSIKLQELMNCFFNGEYRVSQRSAMAISLQFDRHPDTLTIYLDQIISNLIENETIVAVKRNSLRILQFVAIPKKYMSLLFDKCLEFLIDKNEPIAVKAFSMKVLANICKIYPELKTELIPIIELELNRSESKGIHSRGKKTLKELQKLNA